MAKYSAIKAAVNAYIKANGKKEITGRILNSVLNATIDSLGRFFQFAGEAIPTDDPGTPDQNVCYLAGEPGVYTNFGGITIENEEVALLFWDGEWTKQKILIGIQEVEASVDNQVGTPSVDVSYSGGQLVLTFHNLKGEQGIQGIQGIQGEQGVQGVQGVKGDTGAAAGFGTIAADINEGVGTPGVSVETSGDNTAKNLMFHFTNLKGETGVTSVIATIDDTSGLPSCNVSLVNGALTLAFSGLKGLKGDTGVSADYPITIYNGLDSDATDQALAAAQGKVLNGKISQLQQGVNGFDGEIPVSPNNTIDGYGIASNSGQITAAARTSYSVRLYRMTFGKTYHIAIPILSNKYTAAYGFLNESDASSPIARVVTLPSPIPVGSLTNYEADVTAPSETLIYLVVCYETAYGVPTVTTSEHIEGIVGKLQTLEGTVGTIEDAVEAIGGDVDSLQGEIAGITTDTDETLYENEGQIEYYRNLGTATGWNGIGTSTPALAADVVINKIVLPPFKMGGAQEYSVKYFIGHRAYSTGVINTPKTALTQIAEGTIENVGQSFVNDYVVNLETPYTIPAGHQLIVLLYCSSQYCFLLGGGASATENAPYNSEDARAFFTTTSGYVSPFEQKWSIASADASARYKVCNPVLKYVEDSKVTKAIKEQVPGYVEQEVVEIVPEILESERRVSVYLPSKLYAVVGDTLQLFFQGIVGVVNIVDYDIYAECSKGRTYPRYFHYRPTADDIGTTTLTVYVKDRNNNILGQASCDLVTVSAPSSPVSAKSIFTFGDSLTSQGQWPGEAKRRLVGNSTYDSITGNGLSNISFYGYMNKTINGQSVDYFGVGGWSWANYLSKGTGGAFRFYVSGVSSLSIGATYTNNGHTYTIQEINVTGDSGNVRCTTSANTDTPSASGTLTKTSGDGDATITFASYETENANPLWDDANNKMSFVPYVHDCGANTIDAVYVLLSWNGQGSWKEYSVDDTTGHIANAKTFARTLHTEYPSAKLFIMGLQMPSDTGGLGYNYGASGGLIDGQGVKQTAFNYNKALQDLCNLDEFSPYCEFVAIAPQFDSHYNMPYNNVQVNIRNSVTEMLGTNGVHPSDSGYFQIADAVYRSIVANFCQP